MTTAAQLTLWQEDTPPEPPPHPARYSAALVPVLAAALAPAEEYRRLLDPFAGVGGIHRLREFGHHTTGVELEPEWAHQHPDTRVGDARLVGEMFAPGEFDAVATSPAYGNRMADHHTARDDSYRRTYRHLLGRPLPYGNGGGLQWGPAYRDLHAEVWAAVVRLLRPGGRFVLNCRDHTRAAVRQEVTAWHLEVLTGLGLELLEVQEVSTPGFRFGANAAARWPEVVAILTRPEEGTNG
jgi:tRNA G10  N-methylase Trm11